MPEPAVSVRGLRKSYGSLEAVRGIDLEVERGEVFAFLGPNGAGKTTTVEILEGYRDRSGGEAQVLGEDPGEAESEWRERIGIVLQQCRMQPLLTVRETLELYAGYYRSPRPVDATVELAGLTQKADARVGKLSGGQQRRLDVAVALIGDPELLFLDEPTTGFDPSARRQAWEVIGNLRDLGKTVFLTTHYMDEAQTLADRVAIIAGGEIVAQGAPSELGAGADVTSVITFSLPPGIALKLPPLAAAALEGEPANGAVRLRSEAPVELLSQLTRWAIDAGVELTALEVKRPTLEDAYLDLTGGAE